MKRKLYEFCKKNINVATIRATILGIPLLILFLNRREYNIMSFLDVSILASFVLLFISEIVAKLISSVIMARCEDAEKLTEDYDSIIKKYSRENLIEYKGILFPEICLAFRNLGESAFVFDFQLDTENPIYQLPQQVKEHSDELMEAHKYSVVYNNTNIRLNNCLQQESKVKLVYAKTTYYDSLITNRVMDYPIKGKSIREIYEPGPFLSSLSESKLSNHLGFKGFVELADGKIIFIYRNTKVSVGKKTLAASINASYKATYGLDSNRCMTRETFDNAIRMEIKDELKIDLSKRYKLDSCVFSFYRDVVEGGKPQFLFFVKCSELTSTTFEENFYRVLKNKKEKKQNNEKVIIDGNGFEYFTINQLRSFTYQPNGMRTVEGDFYKMTPSSTVSVILLLRALDGISS